MRVTTCFILTGKAEEAAEFYARALGTEIAQRVPDGQGGTMLATFSLEGHEFVVLNGAGPESDVESQRVTVQLHVDGQEEFDRYWFALLEGGTPSQNGWLTDRYGIWWSLVPVQQMEIFRRASADPEALARVGRAAGSMQRIDIAELERAARGD